MADCDGMIVGSVTERATGLFRVNEIDVSAETVAAVVWLLMR